MTITDQADHLAATATNLSRWMRGDIDGANTSMDTAEYLALVQDALAAFRTALVDQLRADGFTWAGVGEVLGISAQAAHKRYGGKND
jgi:hypothetical protein